MSSSNSLSFNLSRRFSFLRKIYIYYNIYIRNFKFFFNSSQFGEDKKIIKLFKEKGAYLDLGCFHPIRYNNTYLMYKSGWSGINIDLNPTSIELFNIARPKDLNLCAAISNKKTTKNLYFHHDLSSLNTLSKNHTILFKEIFGLKNLKKKKIKTQTLNELLKKNSVSKIDFFNIDIEGHELEVLKTIDFNYFKIKVICIEIISHAKYINIRKKKILKFLKKKQYRLKFKFGINYVFVRK